MIKTENSFDDEPLAAEGLTSYRYQGDYGWIMIGAPNDNDALLEAHRSTCSPVDISRLQVWSEDGYVPTQARQEMSP